MNRLFVGLWAVVFSGILLTEGAAEAQSPRFGYINLQQILAEAPGTGDAQQTFEREMDSYRAELERLETELETLQDNFDRQQGTMTAAVREQRQAEMQQKFVVYQGRRMELEETAQRRQNELVGPIMTRILEVTELIRAEGNYAIIFDAAAGAMVTADRSLDLTAQVLQRMRAATP